MRKRLGYLPQDFGVYPRISALDMLDHLALLKGFADGKERKALVDALLHRANLYQVRKKNLATFSGGMLQRFGIAQALIGNPELLIVDEPTAGLDPGERNRFYNLLAEIGEQVVVILSTHIVADVRELCDRLAIIHEGHVLFAGRTHLAVDEPNRKGLAQVDPKGGGQGLRAALPGDFEQDDRRPAADSRVSHEDPRNGFEPVGADLEDVFFTKTAGLN